MQKSQMIMNEQQKDFYQKLRTQIKTWAEKQAGKETSWTEFILLAPDFFHLLCKLMIDKEVPLAKKAKLGAAIAYFISPLDVIPEAIFGPVGYLDDIALAAFVLNDLVNEIDPKIITRNWAGEREPLNLIKTILLNSDKFLGRGLWRKVKKNIK
jgi:uncharacterized membrane protein YkvA (DUF1232 family)